MADLVEKVLSFEINGALFQVCNTLGGGYQEKYYQRAIAKELERRGLKFTEQVLVPLTYQDESIGRYFLDFLIEGKIVLEIKVSPTFYARDVKQVLAYLKATNIPLGILANFNRSGLKIKRILRGTQS